MDIPMSNPVNLGAKFGLVALIFAVVFSAGLFAQDSDDVPLGDVARNMRKKPAPGKEVIDNDNLTKVMDDVESHRISRASFLYSILGGGKSFQVSAPDVTCSLSFSGNAKALLTSPF